MAEKQLDDYQEDLLAEISTQVSRHRRIIAQAETGSGKTVVFATITHRFINKSDKDVLILVDRDKLLSQTRNTLMNWYSIASQKIDADTNSIQRSRVHVAMVETFNNRIRIAKFAEAFDNVGLVIIDEAHIGNFKKLILKYPLALLIGFTATPISADKKDPLKNYYNEIVIGPSPQQLMDINAKNPLRGIVPAREYCIQGNVNRADLRVNRNGEFDEDFMGNVFSKTHQIQNTIDAFIKYAYNTKALVFNANINHSLLMHQAFLDHGFNSRHLDGNKGGQYGNERYRKDCYEWLSKTPNAILNNVGVATTGFDEPSVETVVTNRSINAISLFRQIRGRGGRPYQYPDGRFKDYFIHIDMGDNIFGGAHGRWHEPVDWRFMFENPKSPRPGIGVMKICPECNSPNAASARVCDGKVEDWLSGETSQCGYLFPIPEKVEDLLPREVRLITDGIDVKQCIEFFKDKNEFYSMFQIIKQIANLTRKELEDQYLDATQLIRICDTAYEKVSEWYKAMNKRRPPNFKTDLRDKVIKELKDVGFIIAVEELEILNEDGS